MMKWIVAACLAGVAVFFLVHRGTHSGPLQAQIGWGSSLDDALKAAKTSGKPVLLHLSASW